MTRERVQIDHLKVMKSVLAPRDRYADGIGDAQKLGRG
jgi:hypothetical protein